MLRFGAGIASRLLVTLGSPAAIADCEFGDGEFLVGGAASPVTTQELYNGSNLVMGSVSTGFSCTSIVENPNYNRIDMTLQSSLYSLNARFDGGTTDIPYEVYIDAGSSVPIALGETVEFRNFSVNSLFSAANGTIPLHVEVPHGLDVEAGLYHDTITIFWYARICELRGTGSNCLVPWEGSGTTTLVVELDLTKVCSVAASDIDFGSVSLLRNAAEQSGSISVNCSKTEAWLLGMDAGDNASGSQRHMSNGTDTVSYELLQSDGSVFDDDWTGSSVVSGVGAGHSASAAVTGFRARLTSGQVNVPAGSYTDRVRIRVLY